MRARLLWLLAFALLLLGLMSLLVVSAERQSLPPPPARAAEVALPGRPAPQAGAAEQPDEPAPDAARPLLPDPPAPAQAPAADANGLPLGGGSYADAAHAAFHFSDEAG